MPRRADHGNDYYSQKTTHGQVDHLAHGDGPMETSAQTEDRGEIRYKMVGRPQQNEEGNQRVAQQLADALTARDRSRWAAAAAAPTGPETGIDWELTEPSGTVRPVQITRVGPKDRWALVGSGRPVTGTVAAVEGAKEIADAIERKLLSQDPEAILALSTGQPGYSAFGDVLTTFNRVYLPALRSRIRFAEIWLVGYSLETTIAVWPEDSDRRTG